MSLTELDEELSALSVHLESRRDAILHAWRMAIAKDPALTAGDSLPRVDLYDHIPALLLTFERQLQRGRGVSMESPNAAQESAAAHGLTRWLQGYDLSEVTRELGKLNETVVAELDTYAALDAPISRPAMATARRIWAALCSTGIDESVGQYFRLQQKEAAGHVRDLESALAEIRRLEQQRGDLWQQAAHDLRGNLGVVANVTVGLSHSNLRESSRDDFVRILMRNVTSLHHLLDDVTSLAKLQAGSEQRHVEPIDATPLIQQLCEGIRPLAHERRLFLHCSGPVGFAVDGDAVKIRRIAQNIILNAVKYTREGGITVHWGDIDASDAKRWQLCIADTGPGLHTAAAKPLAHALEKAHELASGAPAANTSNDRTLPAREEGGEGIGLSIVKRLCDMLDATIEMTSEPNVGTTFRILFPRTYPH